MLATPMIEVKLFKTTKSLAQRKTPNLDIWDNGIFLGDIQAHHWCGLHTHGFQKTYKTRSRMK